MRERPPPEGVLVLALRPEPPWWSARGTTGLLLALLALALLAAAVGARVAGRMPRARRVARACAAGAAGVVVLFAVSYAVPPPTYDHGFVAAREPASGEAAALDEAALRGEAPALAGLLDAAVADGDAFLAADGAALGAHRARLDAAAGSGPWRVSWRGWDVVVTEGWRAR